MVTKKIKPEVRFAGFMQEWKSHEMLNCSSSIGDGLHGTPKYVNNSGIFFINGNNLNCGSISITDETKQVSSKELANVNYELGLNTLLISINGTIGNLAWYRGEKVMLGKSVAYVSLKNSVNSYIFSYFQTNRVNDYLHNSLTGSTIKNLGLKAIREMEVLMPKETTEQQKIGTYFQNLDELINQQQQKQDKLRILKKAMLAKMFPANGKNVPEIRFKGFTEVWEEKTLGEIYNFQYGIFNNNPNNGGKYPIYGANGIIGGYTEFNAKDSIVIGHMGEYAGIVLWADGKHFVTYNGIITKPKTDEILAKFGYFLLHRLNLRKICGGSGQPFLAYDTLNKISGVFPKSLQEQKQIGSYFQNLDHLINQHKDQIAKLKQLKKACLTQMFV